MLETLLEDGRSQVQFPRSVIIFNYLICQSHHTPRIYWPTRNEYQKIFQVDNVQMVHKAGNLAPPPPNVGWMSRKCGILDNSHPYRPIMACNKDCFTLFLQWNINLAFSFGVLKRNDEYRKMIEVEAIV